MKAEIPTTQVIEGLQRLRHDVAAQLQACLFPIIDFITLLAEIEMMKTDVELMLHRWPYGLEVQTSRNGLVLRPRHKARANWAKAFRRSLRSSDDLSITRNLTNEFDREEWKW